MLQVLLYVFDGALSFNILVGKCHVHIHYNPLIHSLTHFENLESEVLLAMGSQYQESLAVAPAADHTQSYCYQDRAPPDIPFSDTTTVQDKMTQGKVVLRNPEARLDTGKVA